MSHNLDIGFKNLRLMDSRIEDRKKQGHECATISVNSLHEAEDLMRLLVARNAYDEIHADIGWSADRGYTFLVTVWWN